jgi:Uma2 family endonuclease
MTSRRVWVTLRFGGAIMVAVSMVDDIHPLTVEEYLRLAESSPSWERTELIWGVVYDMAAQYDLHAGTAARIYDAFKVLFPGDIVRFGGSVRLGDHSAVDPDVYVIDGSAPFDRNALVPGELLKVVVEVCVSTHNRDLGPKLRAYAAAGVPQYWVVDPRPEAGYLLRHTGPTGDAYARIRRFAVGGGAEELAAAAVLAGE